MIRSEIINRSPVRDIERQLDKELGIGEIGVISASHGIGKTGCLVHLAIDYLLQSKHIIHVAFHDNTDHIKLWYRDIFDEISRKYELDRSSQEFEMIRKNRIIMNFNQDGLNIDEIEKSIKEIIENGSFSADTLIIDGYNFQNSSNKDLKELKKFANKYNVNLWFTSDAEEEKSTEIPEDLKPLLDEISIILRLTPSGEHIKLNIVHNAQSSGTASDDIRLKLDPKTLLIAED